MNLKNLFKKDTWALSWDTGRIEPKEIEGKHTQEEVLFNEYTGLLNNVVDIKKLNPYHSELIDLVEQADNYHYLKDIVLPEIFFGIDYIAKHVASMNIESYIRKSANIRNYGNEIDYLLNNAPNDYETAYQFKYRMVKNLYYYGSCVILLNGYGNNTQLDILNNCNLITFNEDNIDYYYYHHNPNFIKSFGGLKLTVDFLIEQEGNLFRKDQLMILRLNDMLESPLIYLQKDLGLLNQVKLSMYQQSLKDGVTKGYLKGNHGGVGSREAVAYGKQLNDLVQGSESGFIKIGNEVNEIGTFSQPTFTNLNPVLTNLKKHIFEKIGVPAGLIGGESNQGKNELINLFYSSTLQPLLKNIENSLENGLLSKEQIIKGQGLKFDTSELLRLDEVKYNQVLQMQLDAGTITINEYRLKIGMTKSKDKIANELLPKLYFNLTKEQVNENNTKEKEQVNENNTTEKSN